MTTQILSSVNSPIYQLGQPSQPPIVAIPTQPLTPEQKNTLQDTADSKRTEQVENIKSNYQTAKDLDLTRSYYEQQQKLFDIYAQTTSDSEISNTEENNTSVTRELTNAYSDLYSLHQRVKEGVHHLPNIEQPVQIPVEKIEIDNSVLSHKQANTYNSVMMPSSNSYLHLSA